MRRVSIFLSGDNCWIKIGRNTRITNSEFHLQGDSSFVCLGTNNRIINTKIHINHNESSVVIGKIFTTEGGALLSMEGRCIRIGDDCQFAFDVEVRNSDSHPIYNSNNERINYAESIAIGNHVWLCAHTIVLKGVSIADNSVVSAGAVVTKSSNISNRLIAGIPAKVIKEQINWKRNF